jgi:hypothetical protein
MHCIRLGESAADFQRSRMEKNVTDEERNRQETYDDLDWSPAAAWWASFLRCGCLRLSATEQDKR